MPKELTHWMLAERVLATLPVGGRVQGSIARHRSAYLGGAVLPDTLAHIFRGPYHPTARGLSQRFHDSTGNSYAPLIRAERQLSEGMTEALFACFLGVISHIEADIALHPFVYARASGSTTAWRPTSISTSSDAERRPASAGWTVYSAPRPGMSC